MPPAAALVNKLKRGFSRVDGWESSGRGIVQAEEVGRPAATSTRSLLLQRGIGRTARDERLHGPSGFGGYKALNRRAGPTIVHHAANSGGS